MANEQLKLLLCVAATWIISSSELTETIVTHVDGVSSNVWISCEVKNGLFLWRINNSLYDFNNIELSFIQRANNFYTLIIPQVSLCLNDTTFQCIPSELLENNRRYTRMIVVPLPGDNIPTYSMCSELLSPIEIPSIKINISSLFIGNMSIQFDVLRPSANNCSDVFVSIMDSSTGVITNNISVKYGETFSHSTNNINKVNTSSIYRLSGSYNSNGCQSNDAYTFTGTTSLVFIHPNETLCLPFPNSTFQCNFSSTALFMTISYNCNIRVNPKVDANNTACYRTIKKFGIEINSIGMQVCLSDVGDDSNGTAVNFMCFKQCSLPNCRVIYHYLSSHQIIVSDNTFASISHLQPTMNVSTSNSTFTLTIFASTQTFLTFYIVLLTVTIIYNAKKYLIIKKQL